MGVEAGRADHVQPPRPGSSFPRSASPMQRFVLLLLLAAGLLPAASAQTRARDEVRPSPNAVVGQTIGTTDVTVTYGRPSVRGRAVFGADTTFLAPYGQLWRLGANEATTITVSSDVRVEGQPLAAGTYALFAIPGATEWTLVFNRTAEQWGAYRYDASQDALRVTVAAETDPDDDVEEMLDIEFDDVTPTSTVLTMEWERVSVPVRIETAG